MDKKNVLIKVYIATVFIILALPFVLFFVMPSNSTTENKKLSEFPTVVSNGNFNVNYFKELSGYFEDRFAFRTWMVDINSRIRADIFKTSPEDDVIIGKNGWLYYSATLDDYRGYDLSSDRELYAMAKNIKLIQDYVEEEYGAKFVFTIAPNKNTLYPENMPSQYGCVVSNEHDAYRLKNYLEQLDVNYVNLFSIFASQDEVLYLKGDSHWNKKGAVLAYNAMLDKAGKEHNDYSNVNSELASGLSSGDLSLMIYPVSAYKEDDYKYDREYTYKYKFCSNDEYNLTEEDVLSDKSFAEAEDVTLNEIVTTSENGEGALLMFRDSFGNSLIDLMSEEFGISYFSKMEPYNISKIATFDIDTVILEKVERHIQSLSKVAPLMFARECVDAKDIAAGSIDVVNGQVLEKKIKYDENSIEGITINGINLEPAYSENPEISFENGLNKISGTIPAEVVSVDTDVYVMRADDDGISVYEAFLINENEYCMYIENIRDDDVFKVIVKSSDGIYTVCDKDSDEKIRSSYEMILDEIKAEEELKLEMEKLEQAEAERIKKEKEEEERLKKEAEEAEKLANEKKESKKTTSGKTIVSKVFYEDCGADTGYYEIMWSDGTVTYQDVY